MIALAYQRRGCRSSELTDRTLSVQGLKLPDGSVKMRSKKGAGSAAWGLTSVR
jgi:hypothetical protein